MFCPIMVDISDKKIGIIGGGKIAYRKAKNFLEYNASIIVVSPELRDEFNDLVKEYGDRVCIIRNTYSKEYIEDCFLVVGATSDREVNKQVSIDAKEMSLLCNIVDKQEESNFISPGVVSNDGLLISISTMGRFPYLNKLVKEDLAARYEKFDNEYMDLLMELRQVVLTSYRDQSRNIFDKALTLEKDELKSFIKEITRREENEDCSRY